MVDFAIMVATLTIGFIISFIISFVSINKIKEEKLIEIFTRIIFFIYGYMNFRSLIYFLDEFFK